VTASGEMHQSILDFRKNTGKPVVVSMGDTAASGGYYISTAADRIVANETTLTGSLDVIIPLTNFAEAADKYTSAFQPLGWQLTG
jgi:protease-4